METKHDDLVDPCSIVGAPCPGPKLMYALVAMRLRSLGLTVRLEIISLLMSRGPMTVSDIVAEVELGQPTVSHHLASLYESGWIQRHRIGRTVTYGVLRPGAVRLLLELADHATNSCQADADDLTLDATARTRV